MNPLGSEPITRTRYAAGTRDAKGRWVEGAATSTTIYGSWQPASGEDRKGLPEGLRQRDTRKVYTPSELRAADQEAGTSGDRLTIAGEEYEVVAVMPWRFVIPHYEAMAVRIAETSP